MSDKEYKPVKDMTSEEFRAWLDSPYDPEDPQLSYDHEAWLKAAALLEQRRALDDMARQNAGTKPTPLLNPEIRGFGSFAEEREKRHDDSSESDEQ